MSDPTKAPDESPGGALEPVPPQAPETAPRQKELEIAVVHAAAVLKTLAENQRALRESVDRAERTELLLQNVSGLNDTFRAIAATQSRILESMDDADRRREDAERRARRSRNWALLCTAAVMVLGAAGFYAIHVALGDSNHHKTSEAILAAIRDDVASQRDAREKELQQLASSFRDAMSDRKNYEDRISQLSARERELQQSADVQRQDAATATKELETARQELDSVRSKIRELQERQVGEAEGVQRVMALLNAKGLSVEALRQSLKDQAAHPSPEPADASASRPAGTAPGSPQSFLEKFSETPREEITKLPKAALDQINALLSFASDADIRIVDAAGRSGQEIRDAYFSQYNRIGKPSGMLIVKRVSFEERPTEPRIVMTLHDGAEIRGTSRIPFQTKTVQFKAVDPEEWRRRVPEVFGGVAVARNTPPPDPAVQANAEVSPHPAQPPMNPALTAAMARLNQLFRAHTDYVRLEIVEITDIERDELMGVTLQTLVVDRGATAPRVDQTIRARKLVISHVASDRRLELDFEDGTRGRERPIAFPGGRLHMLLPGVDASELEGGESPVPVRRRENALK